MFDRIHYYINFIISAVFLLGHSACINDQDRPEDPKESDLTTINLHISCDLISPYSINTRDNFGLTVFERVFKHIYFIAVKTSNTTDNKVRIFNLSDQISNIGPNGCNVWIELEKSTYKFYIVANFEGYIDGTIEQNIDQLDDLIANFSTDKSITEDNIPMACNSNEIQYYIRSGLFGGKWTTSSSGIDISESTTYSNGLRANLNILCSKIRYTILFDSRDGCISNSFDDNRIQFLFDNNDSRPYLTYTAPDNTQQEKSLALFRYTFKNSDLKITSSYFNNNWNLSSFDPESDLVLFDGDIYTLNDWNKLAQKAWSGATYITAKVATLNFPYTLIGSYETNPTGVRKVNVSNIAKGQMRDLIILVENLSSFETSSDTRTEIENSSYGFRVLEIQR